MCGSACDGAEIVARNAIPENMGISGQATEKQGDRRPSPWTIFTSIVLGIAIVGVGVLVVRELRKSPQGVKGTQYEYSLDRYANIGADLIGYTIAWEAPAVVPEPRGIAAAVDGTIYVCGDREIVAMDRLGGEIRRFALSASAGCIAVGEDGVLYLGMTDHVEVFNTDDGSMIVWPWMGDNAVITSIAAVSDAVFIADSGNRMVYRFDKSGKALSIIGSRGKPGGRPAFILPSAFFDVAIDPDGGLWIVDTGRHSIGLYSFDGKPQRSWGDYSIDISGFAGCCNPVHLAILPDGSFVTSEKGISRVKVYTGGGEFESVVAGPRDLRNGGDGIDLAATADGGVLMLLPGLDVVRLYEKK
jgi:hypothetical protein